MTLTISSLLRCLSIFMAGVLFAAGGVAGATAQAYPSRTIQLIIPFPAGGLVDAAARLLQPELEKALGRPVIIENRIGAAGAVGTAAVAKAEPDGHTLLMVASSHTVTPSINPNLTYDAERDLAPVVIVAKDPLLFVVNDQVPARTLPELIAQAKADPGKLNYATPGFGSQAHFVTELLNHRAGIKMQHVPYRGGAPAMMAVVTGEAHFAVLSAQVSMPQIERGAIRAIATGGLTRDPRLADVPTVAEAGFRAFEAVQWVGLLAPRGTPQAIVDRLNAVVNQALKEPDVIAKIKAQGMSPAGGEAAEFQALIEAELKQWKELAKAANLKLE